MDLKSKFMKFLKYKKEPAKADENKLQVEAESKPKGLGIYEHTAGTSKVYVARKYCCVIDNKHKENLTLDYISLVNADVSYEDIRFELKRKYGKTKKQRKGNKLGRRGTNLYSFTSKKGNRVAFYYRFDGILEPVCYCSIENMKSLKIVNECKYYLGLGYSKEETIQKLKEEHKARGRAAAKKEEDLSICDSWTCLRWSDDAYLECKGKKTRIRPSYFSTIETLHIDSNSQFGFTERVMQQLAMFDNQFKDYDVIDFICQHYNDIEFQDLRQRGLAIASLPINSRAIEVGN